jgi:hypothetical protein
LDKPTSQPPLPLPAPPPAQYRSRFFAIAGLERRLRLLGQEAADRAAFIPTAALVSALLLTAYAVTEFLLGAHLAPGGSGPAHPVTAWLAGLAGLAVIGWSAVAAAGCRPVFGRQYAAVRQRLTADELARVFVDEERQQQLMDALPSVWWTGRGSRLVLRSLEERVGFCAYHLASLEALGRPPDTVARPTAALEQLARSLAWFYRWPLAFWALALVALLLGMTVVPLLCLALYLALSSRTIAACANAAAFVDVYLGAADAGGQQAP